jgi:hypothetical protein
MGDGSREGERQQRTRSVGPISLVPQVPCGMVTKRSRRCCEPHVLVLFGKRDLALVARNCEFRVHNSGIGSLGLDSDYFYKFRV